MNTIDRICVALLAGQTVIAAEIAERQGVSKQNVYQIMNRLLGKGAVARGNGGWVLANAAALPGKHAVAPPPAQPEPDAMSQLCAFFGINPARLNMPGRVHTQSDDEVLA